MQINGYSLISEALGALTRSESSSEGEETNTESQPTSESTSEFDTMLKGIIGKDLQSSVSEEELFAGLIQERVTKAKGDEIGQKFAEYLATYKESMRHADGYLSFEDAAKAALKDLRSSGDISAEEADRYYSEAFSAAQLDEDKSALFDDRGGPGDATIATQVLEQALLASRVQFEKFDSGEETAEVRSLDEASNAKVVTVPTLSTANELVTSEPESYETSEPAEKVKDKLPDLALALGARFKNVLGTTDKLALDLLSSDSDMDL